MCMTMQWIAPAWPMIELQSTATIAYPGSALW